jgi:predicted permease
MDRNIIFTQVIALFLMMIIGFGARKVKILNPLMNKGLNEILVNITAPCLAITAFQFTYSSQMLAEAGVVGLFAVAAHVLTALLGKCFFFRLPDALGKVLRFTTIFSNCGFMGYPVIGGFFGAKGIFLTSVYVAVFNLFVWTYGVFIFTGKSDRAALRHAVFNPGVVAVFMGMALFLFSLKLPAPLAQTLEMVGAMNTPISMIIIGSMLADLKPGALFSGWTVYYGSVVRLLVVPFLALVILKLLGVHGVLLGVCMLTVAMPAATLSVPLAELNNGDAPFASRVVFLSTIFSIVTIPLMIWMI